MVFVRIQGGKSVELEIPGDVRQTEEDRARELLEEQEKHRRIGGAHEALTPVHNLEHAPHPPRPKPKKDSDEPVKE